MALKKKYPLESLLKIRRMAVDEAKTQLSEAIQDAENKRREMDLNEQMLRTCQLRVRAAARTIGANDGSGKLTPRTLNDRQIRLDRLRREVSEALEIRDSSRKELEQAARAEQKARTRLAETRKQLELLCRHREKWDTSVAIEIRNAEEEASEEISSVAFWNRRTANRSDEGPSGPDGIDR